MNTSERIIAQLIWDNGNVFELATVLWEKYPRQLPIEYIVENVDEIIDGWVTGFRLLSDKHISDVFMLLSLADVNSTTVARELLFLCEKAKAVGPIPAWATR